MQAFARLKARVNKGSPANSQASKPTAAATPPPVTPSIQSSTTTSSPRPPPSAVQQIAPTIPNQLPVQSWPVTLTSPLYGIQVKVYHYMVAQLRSAATEVLTELWAWTFISSGLQPIAGGELVLVVQRRTNEAPNSYPNDFLQICDAVCGHALEQSLVLRRWMVLEVPRPLFGRSDFKAIALAFRNSPLFGLESIKLDTNPIPHFYCIAINDQELALSRSFGINRTLVTMSVDEKSSWYPFPFYVDRDRTFTVTANMMDDSILANNSYRRLRVKGLNVISAESGQVTLNVPEDKMAQFKAAMFAERAAASTSLLIEAEMHDACPCIYFWQRNKETMVRTMTSQSTGNVAANFLVLAFNQSTEAVKVVEDGIMVLLNADNTTRFFQAACNGQDITLQPDGSPFRISWPPYWPTPQFSNLSGSAGVMYLPTGDKLRRKHEDGSHVKVERMILLHEPRAGTASVELLVEFTKKAEAAIIAAIPVEKPSILPQGCGMMAQFRIPKLANKPFQITFLLPSQEAQSAVPMNELQRIVNALDVPEGICYGDYIELQTLFSCWGFDWSVVQGGF